MDETKKEVPITEEEAKKRIVAPHDKKSRPVTEKDLKRVIEDVKVMYRLCFTPNGLYKGAYAVHHSQIDDKDPLNFFVTADSKIVMNPVITNHSNYTKDSKEACMTFGIEPMTTVQRWQKIEVEYITIMIDPEDKEKFTVSSPIQASLSGFEAYVFQHEVDHGEKKYIYSYK